MTYCVPRRGVSCLGNGVAKQGGERSIPQRLRIRSMRKGGTSGRKRICERQIHHPLRHVRALDGRLLDIFSGVMKCMSDARIRLVWFTQVLAWEHTLAARKSVQQQSRRRSVTSSHNKGIFREFPATRGCCSDTGPIDEKPHHSRSTNKQGKRDLTSAWKAPKAEVRRISHAQPRRPRYAG
jgi:hypothetical protein